MSEFQNIAPVGYSLKLSVTVLNQGVRKYESIVESHYYFGTVGKLSNKLEIYINVIVLLISLAHAKSHPVTVGTAVTIVQKNNSNRFRIAY
jgi:fumarate reductase subunit C